MNNFIFQNPTRLIFGKGMISELSKQIPSGTRVLITFGGGSVKKNGVYDQVIANLAGYEITEFWGIEPNPDIDTLRRAITLGREKNVDFLLAVGGGSVIDGTKLIAAGLVYDGDAWDLVKKGHASATLPFGTVLTLPATGSEMNAGAVISYYHKKEKRSFSCAHPQFSILDPQVTYSLPDFQIACGLADTFVHVMEQYLTVCGESRIMDRWAESLLSTLIEIAPQIRKEKTNYNLMADFMLAATMALNGFISMGVTEDWSTHMIGHELTALHGITHGQTLAIILPGTLRALREQKMDKLIQYGERVWGIHVGNANEESELAIRKTEEFFQELGLATRLSDLHIGEETILEIERRFNQRKAAYGEQRNVDGAMAAKILRACL